MNRIFKISAAVLAGVMALASCQQEPTLRLTDVGPETTVNEYTEATYMGADIKFSITVSDKDFALSTIKASLLYDETEVSTKTIRAKEQGTYEDMIHAPLLKDIPDGTATLILASQNVGMGLTYDTLYVSLKRPDFQTLDFIAADGEVYKLAKGENYNYSLTDEFPTDMRGVITTPAINSEGDVITLGWTGSELSELNSNPIPFSSTLAGEYTISVDLKSLTASPFNHLLSTDIDLSESKTEGVYELRQNIGLNFTEIKDVLDWDIDPDFFTVDEAAKTIVFDAVDGYYKFIADQKNAFIRVIPCNADGNALTRGDNNDGAIYMIGGNFGKPVIGPSWNTTDGAYAFAQVAPKVFKLTLNVGGQIKEGFSLKIYSEMGWGGEFLKTNYAKFNGAGVFRLTDTGNIEIEESEDKDKPVQLAAKKAYCFTMDLTNGFNAAELTVEEVEVIGGAALDIQVNGAKADKLSKTIYKVPVVELKKGDEITFTGIDDPEGWFVDPDHFSTSGGDAVCPECGQPLSGLRFNAVKGYYSVELNLDQKVVTVRRVKENGSPATYADEGAITIMAWGVAQYKMTEQLAWENGALITLAEIEDGVYQFTGIAVEETDGETIGGRWRYDYISAKLFGQAGWGDEQAADLNLTDEAKNYIKQSGGSNIEKADGVNLELGATYVMTVTNVTPADEMPLKPGSDTEHLFGCTIDFRKK